MAAQERIDVIRSHLCAQPVVLLQKLDGKIAIVTLNRPNKLNALSREMVNELRRILSMLDRDPNVYVIILTGSGKAFSSGIDLKRYKDPLAIEMQSGGYLEEYWEVLRNMRKPLIAAIGGLAAGDGLELALMCDIVFASEYAKFRLNAIRAGVVSASYAVQTLTKFLGKYRTMLMALTGKTIHAGELSLFGLCKIVKGSVLTAAIESARKLTSIPVATLVAAKAAVKQTLETTMSAGLQAENGLQIAAFGVEKDDDVQRFPASRGRR